MIETQENGENLESKTGAVENTFALGIWLLIAVCSIILLIKGTGFEMAFFTAIPTSFILSLFLYHKEVSQRESKSLTVFIPLTAAILWAYAAVYLFARLSTPDDITHYLLSYLLITGVPIAIIIQRDFWKSSGLSFADLNVRTVVIFMLGGSFGIGYCLMSFFEHRMPLSQGTIERLIELAIIAPVFEEILFRGLILGKLTKVLGSHLDAIALTSILFGIIHIPSYSNHVSGDLANVIVICIASPMAGGFLYGCMKALTGSTIPCITSHAAYNAVTVLGISNGFFSLFLGVSLLFLTGIALLAYGRFFAKQKALTSMKFFLEKLLMDE